MIDVIKPSWNVPKHVQAFTTTRQGGYSLSPFDSMNMALHVGDKSNDVLQNRKILKKQYKLPTEPVWLDQQHTSVVVPADNTYTVPPVADASYSDKINQVCAVLTADCLPILICNKQGTEIAAVHAGWRGLANQIVRETVKKFNSKPEDLVVWFGPAISQRAFEVGEDVKEVFLANNTAAPTHFSDKSPGKYLFNLYAAARYQLNQLGVESVYGGDYCTHTDKDTFYSYRRDNTTGRMATLIWIASQT